MGRHPGVTGYVLESRGTPLVEFFIEVSPKNTPTPTTFTEASANVTVGAVLNGDPDRCAVVYHILLALLNVSCRGACSFVLFASDSGLYPMTIQSDSDGHGIGSMLYNQRCNWTLDCPSDHYAATTGPAAPNIDPTDEVFVRNWIEGGDIHLGTLRDWRFSPGRYVCKAKMV